MPGRTSSRWGLSRSGLISAGLIKQVIAVLWVIGIFVGRELVHSTYQTGSLAR
jgi:hypothetical protein